ncbi:MAG TPA: nuclease-related domain-containing protein [Clostridia bacterium]|nr:nuclease-related domain-containing protein [Clostridia bacterium]
MLLSEVEKSGPGGRASITTKHMAQVFGTAGGYVEAEAVRRRRRLLSLALAGIGALGVLWGLTVGLALPRGQLSVWFVLGNSGVALLGIAAIGKWTLPKLDEIERGRLSMKRGAQGEGCVAAELERLPAAFRVFHDVPTPSGNLDHVVVGPTGVFVLDAKNWRGIVSPDGKGELLLNGKALDKAYVRQFVGRVMGVREQVKVLAPGMDPYFKAVFVFTAAKVDAGWGKTGSAHCMREDQLIDYITEAKAGNRIDLWVVKMISQAFASLVQGGAGAQGSMREGMAGRSNGLRERVLNLFPKSVAAGNATKA